MTTVPRRLAIKFKLKNKPDFEPEAVVAVFQRWIQEHAVEGLLIDVVDYKHVQEGPGVILIADEGDYGYDLNNGVGLRYTRKRFLQDNFLDTLRLTFRLAFIASQRLEDEDALSEIEFDYASAEISFLDRKYYRNDADTLDQVNDELVGFLSELYGDEVTLSRTNDDSREAFSVSYVVSNGDVNVDRLIARLMATQQLV